MSKSYIPTVAHLSSQTKCSSAFTVNQPFMLTNFFAVWKFMIYSATPRPRKNKSAKQISHGYLHDRNEQHRFLNLESVLFFI